MLLPSLRPLLNLIQVTIKSYFHGRESVWACQTWEDLGGRSGGGGEENSYSRKSLERLFESDTGWLTWHLDGESKACGSSDGQEMWAWPRKGGEASYLAEISIAARSSTGSRHSTKSEPDWRLRVKKREEWEIAPGLLSSSRPHPASGLPSSRSRCQAECQAGREAGTSSDSCQSNLTPHLHPSFLSSHDLHFSLTKSVCLTRAEEPGSWHWPPEKDTRRIFLSNK